MKKLSAIAIAVSLGLAGCGQAPQESQQVEQQAAQEAPAELLSGIDLSAMDTNARAQDDFYQYVNGAWLDATEIPADKSRYSVFNVLYDNTQESLKAIIQEAAEASAATGTNEQKLGDMYKSYLDEEKTNALGLEPIQGDLDAINSIENLEQVAAKIGELNAIGVTAPFDFYVYPDAKDPNTYGFWLVQSGLTLPDRDYYLSEDEKFVQNRADMLAYVESLLSAVGHDNAADAAKRIMELETLIAQQHMTRVDSRDAEKNYNKRSLEQVKTMLEGFAWDAYAAPLGLAQVNEVIVRNYSYFESLSELFTGTHVQTWKDYLVFHLADSHAPRLHQELVDMHFGFHSTALRGVPENQPRWKRAVRATSGTLGEVLGQQYVARHFTPEAKSKMDQLVQNLIKAYGESIQGLEWMSDETKVAAMEKLSKFKPKIGYPDEWRDYSSLSIDAGDLVGNMRRSSKFELDYNVSRIGQPVSPIDWGMTPQTINAYYSPTRNEIVFPAGILQPPFFDLEAEDAVNYGAIGGVIGHEIGHGFDDQGSKYDGDGNLRSWWTDADRSAFDALGKKLVEQFNAFEPIEGLNVNGELTLGENIGDLAGLEIGYKAYKMSLGGKEAPVIDGFTGDQRFFMGWAQAWRGKMREDALRAQIVSDPHSPAQYRVLGPVRNVDAFYQAFDVKEGDEMYLAPEDRVQIW